MTPRALTLLPVFLVALAGCVTHTHRESAALRMSRPSDHVAIQTAANRNGGGPKAAYPSLTGDILKGTSPAELAAARAAASQALTQALAQP
jgi:hypothetical protein